MTFIDREREIGALEKAWRETEAQFFVIYGKRRIGKTELIKQFISGKPHIYFLAQRVNENDNRSWLADLVGEHFQDSLLKTAGFPDWRFSSNIAENGSNRESQSFSMNSLTWPNPIKEFPRSSKPAGMSISRTRPFS